MTISAAIDKLTRIRLVRFTPADSEMCRAAFKTHCIGVCDDYQRMEAALATTRCANCDRQPSDHVLRMVLRHCLSDTYRPLTKEPTQ